LFLHIDTLDYMYAIANVTKDTRDRAGQYSGIIAAP